MVDIDDKESELLAQVIAAGVVRFRGDDALVARRLAGRGLLRAIAARPAAGAPLLGWREKIPGSRLPT